MASNGMPGPASRALTRFLAALSAIATLAVVALVTAAPVLAQEGGHGEPVPVERKLLAIAILVAFVAVMVAWVWLYRRVNRA